MQPEENYDNFMDNYLGRPPPSLSRVLNSKNETGLEQFLNAMKNGDLETVSFNI
jgi:hypothetical protein